MHSFIEEIHEAILFPSCIGSVGFEEVMCCASEGAEASVDVESVLFVANGDGDRCIVEGVAAPHADL